MADDDIVGEDGPAEDAAPTAALPPAWAPPPMETERKTSDERKARLAATISAQVARGARVESQSDYQAVVVTGKPVNHVLHLILTLVTCGLWGIVWIVLAVSGGEKRSIASVDEFGNAAVQRG